jgi:putative PIN family toxin of toxin-antitoxin system
VLRPALVIDTNIVLDLWVFDEPAVQPLRHALQNKTYQWLATHAMRDELARVLGYPPIVRSLAFHGKTAEAVLHNFDQLSQCVEAASKACFVCKDADDQKFIDLAMQHQATLLSKDHAVLCMKKRLLTGAVSAQTAIDFVANI